MCKTPPPYGSDKALALVFACMHDTKKLFTLNEDQTLDLTFHETLGSSHLSLFEPTPWGSLPYRLDGKILKLVLVRADTQPTDKMLSQGNAGVHLQVKDNNSNSKQRDNATAQVHDRNNNSNFKYCSCKWVFIIYEHK